MKNIFTKKIILSLIIVISFFSYFSFAFQANAASSRCGGSNLEPLKFTFNVPLPGFMNGAQTIEIDCLTLGDYIKYIYQFVIGLTGLLSVFMITLGAIMWIFSGGNSKSVSQAKQYISGSITGILLAIGSYSILYIINPQLVEIKKVEIPMAKKALLSICENSGTNNEDREGRVFISKKDVSNRTNAKNTWCGMEYSVQGGNNNTCFGFACGIDGNADKLCTPALDPNDLEKVRNVATEYSKYAIENVINDYSAYTCKSVADLRKTVIYSCNNTRDEDKCGLFDGLASTYRKVKSDAFSENERCVWQDYTWYNLVSNNTCRWCPDSYYTEMDKIFKADPKKVCGELNSTSNDDKTPLAGICPTCFDPMYTVANSTTQTQDIPERRRMENACIKLLFPKYCK